MNLIKIAEILSVKYAASADETEASLRRDIEALWNLPNKSFNILKACAESNASKPKNANERKAVAGYKFCKELVELIDYLKFKESEISIPEIREALLNIVNLIDENLKLRFDEKGVPSDEGSISPVQFPHVSELIFQLTPVKTKHQIKLRDDLYGKARTGLSRILSLSNSMIDKIKELEILDSHRFQSHTQYTDVDINQENPNRFKPQKTEVSKYDVLDFINQHGEEYGINTKTDWELVFRNDPQLKNKMTTVINALNRGHSPMDAYLMKQEIAQILEQHKGKANYENL